LSANNISMQKHSRRALVLSHLSFEDIGSLDVPLRERGFDIETVDVATACFPLQQAESCDLLVVLGGPIGAYDQQNYPFLKDEVACIGQRLAARKPILGICLGVPRQNYDLPLNQTDGGVSGFA
jgi:GMP synthase (glutamine-hydrolysing)